MAGDPASSPYPDARAVARLIGDPWSSPLRAYWVGAAAFLGVAALALWEAAVSPPGSQRPWRWRGWAPLLTGMGIGFAAVVAGLEAEASWPVLGRATLWAVHRLLTLVFPEVVYDPTVAVVGTPGFTVRIAPACSGYEGIGLVLVFVGAYLWLDRRHLRFPRALLLLPLGAAAIWLANAVRITALVAVGAWVSPRVALGASMPRPAGWRSTPSPWGWSRWRSGRDSSAPGRRRPSGARPPPPPTWPRCWRWWRPRCSPALSPTGSIGSTRPACWRRSAALAYFRRAYTGLRWSWSWPAFASGCAGVRPLGGGGADRPPRARWAAACHRRGRPCRAAWAAVWLIGRVVGSVVVVPLAEELAFRGYLVRRLIAADFEAVPPGRLTWPSLLISSPLFGALHGRWLAGMAAGAVYALAQWRRGELGDAVLAHGTTNGLLTAYALATGDWSSWS